MHSSRCFFFPILLRLFSIHARLGLPVSDRCLPVHLSWLSSLKMQYCACPEVVGSMVAFLGIYTSSLCLFLTASASHPPARTCLLGPVAGCCSARLVQSDLAIQVYIPDATAGIRADSSANCSCLLWHNEIHERLYRHFFAFSGPTWDNK